VKVLAYLLAIFFAFLLTNQNMGFNDRTCGIYSETTTRLADVVDVADNGQVLI